MSGFNNTPLGISDGYNLRASGSSLYRRAVLSDLPSAVWSIILSYLSHSDMRNLMLLNQEIKREVEPHLYMELTLTEWASSGARLARAIQLGIVSNETCACIRRLRILFTSIDEIREALEISLAIQPRMSSVEAIDVEAHKTEDAYYAVKVLVSRYTDCVISVSARAPPEDPISAELNGVPSTVMEVDSTRSLEDRSAASLASSVLPLVSSLRLPLLYGREAQWLHSITSLDLEQVVEDGISVQLPANRIIHQLALPYRAYVYLGSPAADQLEIRLDNEDSDISINDPACGMLKLVATTDIPQIEPHIRCPSLKALILCNLAPLPTIKLAELNKLDTVEFISIAPVTIPAVQAIASKQFLPSLKLVLAMVTRTSFLSQTASLRKREARKLVEWLQVLASTYPVDVRDFSRLLKDDIYFSDGLWCLAAQTQYRKYLAYVAPPPLKSA